MRRTLISLLVSVGLILALAAVPASAAGTSKYVWDDTTPAYAGPAAMLVNNAGAIVWWHIPDQTQLYKDVYRFDDFDSATYWGPVGNLNSPVNSIMLAHFPTNPVMWYTREMVDVVPNLGKPTSIFTLRDYRTMTAAETGQFYLANQTLSGGFVTIDPYAPDITVSAYGLQPNTSAYVGYIGNTGTWQNLGSLTTGPDGSLNVTLTLNPATAYSGYFAINYAGGTQFIAGPFSFTTAGS